MPHQHYYYNKFSGEVRWRKPQDLLNLMPKPRCSDCQYFQAAIECAECQEFFCNQCWCMVHRGGKRASHEFRVLFDFYNRRIDYGDDEFPSKWPTDIQQDETVGWQLRIKETTNREPIRQLGDWDEYLDEDNNRSL